jgi:hypothetical protein
VVPRTTIAIHPTTELLAARPRLHHSTADFTVSHFTDA